MFQECGKCGNGLEERHTHSLENPNMKVSREVGVTDMKHVDLKEY